MVHATQDVASSWQTWHRKASRAVLAQSMLLCGFPGHVFPSVKPWRSLTQTLPSPGEEELGGWRAVSGSLEVIG